MSDPLDELAEALAAATPGEWLVGQHPRQEHVCVVGGLPVRALTGTPLASTEADAHFIALCGTHVGILLERLRAAEKEVERLRAVLELARAVDWGYVGNGLGIIDQTRCVGIEEHAQLVTVEATFDAFLAALYPQEPSQ